MLPGLAAIVRTPQGASCPSFTPLPWDRPLTLPEAYDFNFEHSPDHVLYAWADGDTRYEITWREATLASHSAARLVSSYIATTAEPRLAIFAAADTITCSTLLVGILRAGLKVFVISTRNSATALAHLLDQGAITHVFSSADPGTKSVLDSALERVQRSVIRLAMPSYADLYRAQSGELFPRTNTPDLDDIAVVLHSSGSTSFPKLVPISHRALILGSLVPSLNDVDLAQEVMACHSLPLFHIIGLTHIGLGAYCGLRLAVFPPRPVQPTPDNILSAALDTASTMLYTLPVVIEALAEKEDNIAKMSRFNAVVYGGAPLRKAVGDSIVSQGGNLIMSYGLTECGVLSTFFPSRTGDDWEWFRFSPHVRPHLQKDADGTAELVIIPSALHRLDNVINCEVDDQPAFTTKDLLVEHPTKTGMWKVFGRVDDQIMHSTGEKTNPIPLESMLLRDPHVATATMFGRGRSRCGVLITPKPDYIFDPSDETKLVSFRNSIWPTVERLNAFAPSHSRLFKEMIMVTSKDKPLQMSSKGFPLRSAALAAYEHEIDVIYAAFEESSQSDFPLPASWALSDALIYVRALVESVIDKKLQDTDDLFLNGCDSLKATWIRNSIARALRETTEVGDPLSTDFVYEAPSIAKLASAATAVAGGQGNDKGSRIAAKLRLMEMLLAKYTRDLCPRGSLSFGTPATGDVLLVTGTTGALGSSFLAHALAHSDMSRIYALNRSGHQPNAARQAVAFKDRGLDEQLLLSPKLVFLEGDVASNDLGLAQTEYDAIRNSVTHIVHLAWPVNFNLSLQSFEPALRGVRHLVDLAVQSTLSYPPKIVFASSITVVRKGAATAPPEEEPVTNPEDVLGSGYGESKWLAERILQKAAHLSDVPSVVVRIGQIVGGENGCWNASDWFPAIVRSAGQLGGLPNTDSVLSWTRLHEAAAALFELRNSTEPTLHLVHPHPVPWAVVANACSSALDVPLLPYHDWLPALLACVRDGASSETLPAARLINFFEDFALAVDSGNPVFGERYQLSIDKASRGSETLRTMKPLTAEDARSWIQYWRSRGVLAAS